jgi:hypothetical protein
MPHTLACLPPIHLPVAPPQLWPLPAAFVGAQPGHAAQTPVHGHISIANKQQGKQHDLVL